MFLMIVVAASAAAAAAAAAISSRRIIIYGTNGFLFKEKPGERKLDINAVLNADVNKAYLEKGKLNVQILDKGTAWLDTGTFDSLMQASHFVQVIEQRQGLKIGCIEEIAYKKNYISKSQLLALAEPLLKSGYGKYLQQIAEE